MVSLSAAGSFRYREALPGYRYQFPRDHFEHEDFRTEWWYYTGNVRGPKGERYGFELVFFRQGQRREGAEPAAGVWSLDNVYLAHAALTDAAGRRFRFDERLNRKGPGVAGASFSGQRVWNGNWSVAWAGERQTLDAIAPEFRFHLVLNPETPAVIHGENGVSQKAEGAGRASHYVSFPRLAAKGEVTSAGNNTPVTGTAWMDHEWFTEQLSADQVGWDWFSIQLDNHTELMLFQLRRKDGSIDPNSSGTFVDAGGKAIHLKRGEFTLEPGRKHGSYPVEWRITVPPHHIDIRARAVMDDQTLRSKSQGPSYWEGAVDYAGTHSGVGYLEMTGYEGAVKF